MDLAKPADFAKLTLSNASSLANLLSGGTVEVWDVQETSYGHENFQVKFHIFETPADYDAGVSGVDDKGGRRKAIFRFPYRDGQTTDDLGSQGREFEIKAIIHGKTYKTALKKLLFQLDQPQPGELIHPINGKIKVVPLDWNVTHSSESVQAAMITIKFITHDFEVSFDNSKKVIPKTFKNAISAAVGFFAKIDNVLNKVTSNILAATQLKNAAIAAIKSYKDLFNTSLQKMNATFNSDGTSTDIPALNPTNTGGVFPVAGSLNSVLQSIPDSAITSNISIALGTQQATDNVKQLIANLNATIVVMSDGDGAILFRDEILELKRSALAVQATLELGIQSSQAQIRNYKLPRLMSVREVCFANNLSLERVYDLEVLNPNLESLNFIPKGTIVKVLVV